MSVSADSDKQDVGPRLVDQLRDSAASMDIGAPEEGVIKEMFGLQGRMILVLERAIYAVQLADAIDPDRSNIAIPNTQQRLFCRGAQDPLVAKTLLTARTLFKKLHLGQDFDEIRGVELALELLKDLAAMADVGEMLEKAQAGAITEFERSAARARSLVLPTIGEAEPRFEGFAQKVGHAVDTLCDIARLFYGDALTKKWVDSLVELLRERH